MNSLVAFDYLVGEKGIDHLNRFFIVLFFFIISKRNVLVSEPLIVSGREEGKR